MCASHWHSGRALQVKTEAGGSLLRDWRCPVIKLTVNSFYAASSKSAAVIILLWSHVDVFSTLAFTIWEVQYSPDSM